jgi:hypothetical protein
MHAICPCADDRKLAVDAIASSSTIETALALWTGRTILAVDAIASSSTIETALALRTGRTILAVDAIASSSTIETALALRTGRTILHDGQPIGDRALKILQTHLPLRINAAQVCNCSVKAQPRFALNAAGDDTELARDAIKRR